MKEESFKSDNLLEQKMTQFKCSIEVLQKDVGDKVTTIWEKTNLDDAAFIKVQNVPNLLDINGVEADPTSGNVTLSIIDLQSLNKCNSFINNTFKNNYSEFVPSELVEDEEDQNFQHTDRLRKVLGGCHANLQCKAVMIDLSQQLPKPNIAIDGVAVDSSLVDRVEISQVLYNTRNELTQ